MASTAEDPPPTAPATGRVIARWALVGLGVVLALVAGLFVFLGTDAGRRFVADRVEAIEFENGMKIGIGELDGSLFGRLVIRDLSLADPTGRFLAVPEAKLDWRPLSYLWGYVDIRTLEADRAMLIRLPELREVEQTGPLLPDLDIDVGSFRVGRLELAAAVTGERRDLALSGDAHIADRRAVVKFAAQTIGIEDGDAAAGDHLFANIDAVPDDGRLAIDLKLTAPQGGVIAAMAGLTEPLTASIAGAGDWKRWDGRLTGTTGGRPLADIALAAREGTFTAKGESRIAELFTGRTAQLLGPVNTIDLSAAFDARRADVEGSIASETLRLQADGIVDLGRNRFDRLALDLAVLRPAALADDLEARGLQANLLLDGPFETASVEYGITAARLGIAEIALERLTVAGNARLSPDGFIVPIDARAARITGLDSVAGGRLDNVRLSGNLAVKGARVLSDDLRLVASRIDATATVVADIGKGFYAGAINGKLRGYRVESVGIFDLDTRMGLETGARGGFALKGRVGARSTRITNEALANFFGGPVVAASNVSYDTDGIVRLAGITLNAPLVRVANGSGFYSPGGRVALDLDATTERYGPINLSLTGTTSQPRAVLKAQSPGLGIGLADLSAEITGIGRSFAFNVTGQTDYGPLTADIALDASAALAIDVRSADIGGIGLTGSLAQVPQGPFAGRLAADGRGLKGIVNLFAQGEYQAAQFSLRAKDTRLDGPADLRVGSAIIDGRAVLYDQPEVVFDAQFSDAAYQGYRFSAARAQVDYQAGAGSAKVVLEGARALPFHLAAAVRLEPELWSATIRGSVRDIDVATRGAARIVPGDNGYRLLPTTIAVGNGTARLAGEYGTGLSLQGRVENMDLALVNNFVPSLGIGGRASGSIDFAQSGTDGFPSADARLRIDNFTRTTAVSVSEPVDVNFAGKLLADGGEGSAVFRSGGAVIGRMQASLRPLSPGAGGWTERLLGAPLSGGIRYNGPAGTLFSLTGQAQQRLSGGIGLAGDFSGRLQDPKLTGVIKANDLTYENLAYGTRLTNMAVDGRFVGDRVEIISLSARAGDGTVKAKGTISLAAARGFPMDISIDLEDAQLAHGDDLSASATGHLDLTKREGETALLSGTITLPQTRYRLVRQGAAQVTTLSGVRFRERGEDGRIAEDEALATLPSLFDRLRLSVTMTAPERFYVSGMGLESEWRADLTISGTSDAPRLTGSIHNVRGTLGFAGRSFEIAEGTITFDGNSPIDPRLALTAAEDVDGLSIQLAVTGRSTDPQIAFSSVPDLPQEEIVSRILFGRTPANLTAVQALQLAASLNSLRGAGGGFNPLEKLRSATGVDRLRVLGADEENGRGTALAAGKYVTDDIYIEVITDARGFTATQLEISLTRALSVLSQAGGSGTNDFSIQYEKNY